MFKIEKLFETLKIWLKEFSLFVVTSKRRKVQILSKNKSQVGHGQVLVIQFCPYNAIAPIIL